MTTEKKLRYADIGINLSDPIFRGTYRGKQSHPDDLPSVISRASSAGVEKMMVTGSDLTESAAAISLAKEFPGLCYATVGVHPCSATTFQKYDAGPEALLDALVEMAKKGQEDGSVVAVGEIGLDYDRLHYADGDVQREWFERQLDAFKELKPSLPLFLHSRAAADDFERILKQRLDHFPKRGLVHSFTGSKEEMERLVELGLDIGVNGCSLKTEENLEVVKVIPLSRLQIETDGPWCEIRPSHASHKYLADAVQLPKAVKKEKWIEDAMVKGRNEPCTIPHVAHVIAKVKGIPVEDVCEAAWNNSVKMFGLGVSP